MLEVWKEIEGEGRMITIDEHEAGDSHLDTENCSNGKDGGLPASSTIFIIMIFTKMGITHGHMFYNNEYT